MFEVRVVPIQITSRSRKHRLFMMIHFGAITSAKHGSVFKYLMITMQLFGISEDLKAIQPHDDDKFWKVNKYLLNYVNVVFCYRVFI